MTLRRYLSTMALTTAVCWAALVVVIFRIDPYTAGAVGLMLFFTALFFALWGSLSLLGFGLRFIFMRNTVPFRYIGVSLRQSLWFAIMINLSLFLASQNLLVWWMSILLVIGLAVLEAFFLARSLEARYYQRKVAKQRRKKPAA